MTNYEFCAWWVQRQRSGADAHVLDYGCGAGQIVTLLRARGIAARYVSGYLFIEDKVEQEAGHAWAEAHVTGLGWVGFDVSNRICPDQHYIRVATGRDYADAAPIHAMTFGGGDTSMLVSLRVDQ